MNGFKLPFFFVKFSFFKILVVSPPVPPPLVTPTSFLRIKQHINISEDMFTNEVRVGGEREKMNKSWPIPQLSLFLIFAISIFVLDLKSIWKRTWKRRRDRQREKDGLFRMRDTK